MGRNRRSSSHDDDGRSSPRGFNNPHLSFTVKFKNKVVNNNYEFIVTIQSDEADEEVKEIPGRKKSSDFFKQYKVKRNLYEFQELFNYLEQRNPSDLRLREFDYNQMFQTFNASSSDGKNIDMLQDFMSCVVQKGNPAAGETTFLIERRVQEFIQIDDPEVAQKILMMSLTTEPTSKIYTELKIIDEYQTQSHLSTPPSI